MINRTKVGAMMLKEIIRLRRKHHVLGYMLLKLAIEESYDY